MKERLKVTIYIIKKSPTEDRFLKTEALQGVMWITEAEFANKYNSRYAAKKAKTGIDAVPMDAMIVTFR